MILDTSIRFAVFTATATAVTRNRIFETIGLDSLNTFSIEKSPMQNNIKFSVSYIGNDKCLEDIFKQYINSLHDKGRDSKKVLIYCHSRTQCALLWQCFQTSLANKFYSNEQKDPQCRLVEMFDAGTAKQVKDHILRRQLIQKVIFAL